MSDLALFLIVDDNEDDIVLIRRAFVKGKILNPLYAVRSGEEAMAYLAGEGRYRDRREFPLPALVLLDLKMPGVDGFDVLRWVRQQPGLSGLRVVILTSSDEMRDVSRAYELGANSFLIKPTDFDRFVQVSQALSGYWIWLSVAPEVSRPGARESDLKQERPDTLSS